MGNPPEHRSHGNTHVKAEAEKSDHQNHFRTRDFQIPEIDGECSTEKEERKLQHDRHKLQDQVQSLLLQSQQLCLSFLPSISDITPARDPSVIQDPLSFELGFREESTLEAQVGHATLPHAWYLVNRDRQRAQYVWFASEKPQDDWSPPGV